MSAALFVLSDVNPNDQIGGGGCVCSPTKIACEGPYAVFPGCETDSNISPHVVVGVGCARFILDQAAQGNIVSASADVIELEDDDVIDVTKVTPVDARPEQPENPSSDDVPVL